MMIAFNTLLAALLLLITSSPVWPSPQRHTAEGPTEELAMYAALFHLPERGSIIEVDGHELLTTFKTR